MTFISLRSFHATSIRHHDRGLTLVFGSDGQVSLIGFDGGVSSQGPFTLTASNTGLLTATHSLPSQSTLVSPIPHLAATSAPLTGISSSVLTQTTRTSTLTPLPSPSESSSHDPTSTATDTDTDLPSIPTASYLTPSPTPVSNPRDHGVGAPFYLAIVLASISFVGCVAAFIAWWIRSRSRRRDLEFDDPWPHRDTISENGSPFTNNANPSEMRTQTHEVTQTRPYYLPASIVRRNSSNLLAIPHTMPSSEGDTSSTIMRYLSWHHENRYKNLSSRPNPSHNVPFSQTPNRPGAVRLQTGLSVQESMRTLGRLRVANRVPGDVTSGDEGGINVPRSQNDAGLPPATNAGGPDAAPFGENVMQNTRPDQSDRSAPGGDVPSEPPGPATLPWGRRMDTIAALRRTRRRTPGTTVQTYKNSGYSGYLYPNGGASGAVSQAPAAVNQEETEKKPPPDVLGWKNSLKSSFWQAVDAMTGNRPSDPELRSANGGDFSRFTPAPQRIASRQSPVSPIPSSLVLPLPGIHTAESEELEIKYDSTLSDKSVVTQETPQNSNFPEGSDDIVGRADSVPARVSRLNCDIRDVIQRRHPDSVRVDTGSVYSTNSATARANLRKYGYGNSIPSSWSALGQTRESQLELDSLFLPLPRPMLSSSPIPLSVATSQLTLESGVLSGSVSTRTRTRTPAPSESDFIGSDAHTVRSGQSTNAGEVTAAGSTYSMSRNGSMQSGRGTIGHGSVPSHSSSTASSMVSRKKGVTRKRPRPPPRVPSSASSVQSLESGLSIRDIAVKRALLERRKKVKAAENLKGPEDGPVRSRDASGFHVHSTIA